MPAEDYGDKLVVDASTKEETLVSLTVQQVAERDALAAASEQDTADGVVRATNESVAISELRDLWTQMSFVNNVKRKNQTEIRTWVAGLSAAQQADTLADSIWAIRNIMLVLQDVLDAMDEGG